MMIKKAVTRKSVTESKRDRFVRLAERRTTTALQMIRLIGNLANRNNYHYVDADTKKILSALGQELDNLKRKFSDAPGRDTAEFRL